MVRDQDRVARRQELEAADRERVPGQHQRKARQPPEHVHACRAFRHGHDDGPHHRHGDADHEPPPRRESPRRRLAQSGAQVARGTEQDQVEQLSPERSGSDLQAAAAIALQGRAAPELAARGLGDGMRRQQPDMLGRPAQKRRRAVGDPSAQRGAGVRVGLARFCEHDEAPRLPLPGPGCRRRPRSPCARRESRRPLPRPRAERRDGRRG